MHLLLDYNLESLLVSIMALIWQTRIMLIYSHQVIVECLYSTGLGEKRQHGSFKLLWGLEIIVIRMIYTTVFANRSTTFSNSALFSKLFSN